MIDSGSVQAVDACRGKGIVLSNHIPPCDMATYMYVLYIQHVHVVGLNVKSNILHAQYMRAGRTM